ncbi:MAG TPA: signal peptide peptidase SppA [candidate division Zixibacteria bacterium]|nr:signal peptide peptidase SppA [candidate division Zixibacteria bacterium]
MAGSRNVILIVVAGGFLILFLVFFIIGIMGMMGTGTRTTWIGFGDRIAIVTIEGQILESESTVRQLREFAENGSVKGILLRINSPGGIVSPAQEIYDEVKRIREEYNKPVVVSMGSVAASGGYYIACSGDYVFANPGTLTGSIGVILQYPVLEELMGKIGVEHETIKSGDVKDVGSPFRQPTREDSVMLQAAINDIYSQFVDVVVKDRGLEHEEVIRIADGSIFTGNQALELGLVDALGSQEAAIEYLADLAGIEGDIKRIRPRVERQPSLWDLLGSLKQTYVETGLFSGPTLMYLYR